jgi:hypothetical protein
MSNLKRNLNMNKIKYIAAILIGIAGLGLQQARADFVSQLTASNGEPNGDYGTVTVSNLTVNGSGQQVATITFTSNAAGGFYFVDGGAAAVYTKGNSATGDIVSEVDQFGNDATSEFSSFTYHANNDGFGEFTVRLNNQDASVLIHTITFTVTNTSNVTWTSESDVLAFNGHGTPGWDASAHYVDTNIPAPNTFFAGEGVGTIPDGGTTVMLLGTALGALGMARRYLKR